MKKLWLTTGLIVALTGLTPAAASAQVSITPFAGLTFGADAPAEKFTTGVSVSFMGDVAGLEIDLGYTPDFFNDNPDQVILVGDSNLTTLMANLIVGVGGTDAPVRPYVVAGLGLVRSRIDFGDLFDEVSTNEFGLTLGGGVTGQVSDNVGIRGDVRYIRSLEDPEDDGDSLAIGNFDFWRATAGVVFSIP
jgi:opacity protein-like surface antigen